MNKYDVKKIMNNLLFVYSSTGYEADPEFFFERCHRLNYYFIIYVKLIKIKMLLK